MNGGSVNAPGRQPEPAWCPGFHPRDFPDTISVQMQLRPTDDQRALQEEVRDFLAKQQLAPADLPHSLDERIEALREWQAAAHAAGYVGRAWPREFGGGGRPAIEQIIVDQEL